MADSPLTEVMLDALRKTRPWVRFLSVLGFLLVGLMIVAAVAMTGYGISRMSDNTQEAWVAVAVGVFYLAFSIIYLFPVRYLSRYASAITDALQGPAQTEAVERALLNQKSFWKFAGIMTIVTVLIYVPLILAAIAIPNLMSATQRAKQKRSMADLRSIGTAVEAYATDHNAYPAARNIDELRPLITPMYIKSVPPNDGWGKPFIYEPAECADSKCQRYYIASGGKNMALERARPSEYGTSLLTTATFDADLVYSNGDFIVAPEGIGYSSQ
jgi:type II secretory pathway pseudopilin PulG